MLCISTLDQGPQFDRAVRDFEIVERTPKVAGCHPEDIAHLGVDHDHKSVGVDPDNGERSRLEGQVTELPLPAHLPDLRASDRVKPYRHRLVPRHGRAWSAPENSLAHADHFEALTIG